MARTAYNALYDSTVLTADGTAGTNVTCATYGHTYKRTVVLTLSSVDVPDIAGGAALGVGALIWTAPAGVMSIRSSYMNVAIQQVDGNITADTPEVSLGNVIVTGAVATMTTATWENILTAQVATDCDGTAIVANVDTVLDIAAAGAHTVYLNIADTWAASGDANATVSGTVIINYDWYAAA